MSRVWTSFGSLITRSYSWPSECPSIAVAQGDRIPQVQDPVTDERETGPGLRIVAAYADRWGVDAAPATGKTVWAELALAHRIAGGHAPARRDAKDQRTGERTEPTPAAPVDHPQG
ncbi:hypothetical protein AB0K80_03700 [Streptomyces sp. NPDC052682]|uniref:hypothetical protein n=1 Tax=Streptomyces sp. NPDC052682 TaxID=3154954 RepID=UPI0034186426